MHEMTKTKRIFSSVLLTSVMVIMLLSSCDLVEKFVLTDIEESESTVAPSQDYPDFDLDPTTEATLAIYPLRVGNSWVYDYMSYDANQEVIWRVTETVVDARIFEGYYVAELEKSAVLIQGTFSEELAFSPELGTFWFLVDGESIYKFDDYPKSDLTSAWLEWIIPFPQGGEGWYPDPEKRFESSPGLEGFRTASEAYKDSIPNGETFICYNVVTESMQGKQEGTFCETVGFFFFEEMEFDRPMGYKMELRDYSLE
jgi:hypothetical protein